MALVLKLDIYSKNARVGLFVILIQSSCVFEMSQKIVQMSLIWTETCQ